MNDEQYNELVRRQLREQANNYFAEIEHNKDAVWDRINNRLPGKRIVPLWIYSAAAAILIFMCLGIIFNYLLEKRNTEIANLKAQLELKKTRLEITSIEPIYKPNHSGSINYVNSKIVYVPIKFLDTIVLHDTINNLVLKTDTVFINDKEIEQIAKEEKTTNEKFTEKKEIVVNQESKVTKRERRFIFKFGKTRDETPTNDTQYETKGLITLKSK